MNQSVLPAHVIPRARPRGNLLYVVLPAIMLVLLLLAFGTRYLQQGAGGRPPFPWYVHVHALLFTGWFVLVLSQAALIRSDAAQAHRRAGMWGMALAVLMFVTGIYSAIEGARHGHNPARFSDALAFLAVPLTDILLFGVFMLGAWQFRSRPEFHKKFVLLAMVGGFTWPIVTRLPLIVGSFPAALGLLAALVMAAPLKSALLNRRWDWIEIMGGIVILLSVPMRRLVGESEGWHQIARWLVA